MENFYFTFGQDHIHEFDNLTFDKDSVIKVIAPSGWHARTWMFEQFGGKWCLQYSGDAIDLSFYPRGVIAEYEVQA